MDELCSQLASLAQAQSDYGAWQRRRYAEVTLHRPRHSPPIERDATAMTGPLPEISLELARLDQIGEGYQDIAAQRLDWQLGCETLPAVQGPYLRRLRGVRTTDVRGPHSYANDHSPQVVTRCGGFAVLWPCAGLFQDLLPRALYPHEDQPVGPHLDEEVLSDALARLCQDAVLERLITAIAPHLAIVPMLPLNKRQSFNCRLTYPGVIFLGFHRQPEDVAADILHEFLHQLLWLAAWKDPDGWLPIGSDHLVRSPVTNREKDAAVMVHACLIYAALFRFRELIGLQAAKAADFASASRQIHEQLAGVPGLSSFPATMRMLGLAEGCRLS